jgi:hypothetical protein
VVVHQQSVVPIVEQIKKTGSGRKDEFVKRLATGIVELYHVVE